MYPFLEPEDDVRVLAYYAGPYIGKRIVNALWALGHRSVGDVWDFLETGVNLLTVRGLGEKAGRSLLWIYKNRERYGPGPKSYQ